MDKIFIKKNGKSNKNFIDSQNKNSKKDNEDIIDKEEIEEKIENIKKNLIPDDALKYKDKEWKKKMKIEWRWRIYKFNKYRIEISRKKYNGTREYLTKNGEWKNKTHILTCDRTDKDKNKKSTYNDNSISEREKYKNNIIEEYYYYTNDDNK